MSEISEKIQKLRFDRMRLGPAVGRVHPIPSQPDVQVAIVPLTEAEHQQCLDAVVALEAPETVMGAAYRDRRNNQEFLWRALRNPENLDEKAFDSREEMMESLELQDITTLTDMFFMMAESDNPEPQGFTDEEMDEIKKVLEGVDLKEFSGRQWYALRLFLSSLGMTALPASLLGSTSINSLTTTNDESESINTAYPNSTETPAKSVENQL